MEKIKVELVTPEKLLFSADADMVVIPGAEGDFGVLQNHSPMISTIRPGIVSLHDGNSKRDIFISGGFTEVTPNCCTILAEKAEDTADLSEEEIRKLYSKAQKDAA